MCLIETICDSIHNPIENFQAIFKTNSKGHYRHGGIHGLCVLVKNEKAHLITVIENTKSETTLWLKVDSQAFGVGFIIGSVYIPSKGSIHHDPEHFEDIADDLINFKVNFDLPVILIGDLNSRTGTIPDVLDIEVEQDTDDGERINSDIVHQLGLTERSNKDLKINNNGRKLIILCKTTGLILTNGRVGKDSGIGQTTCRTANGESTIDYALVSF